MLVSDRIRTVLRVIAVFLSFRAPKHAKSSQQSSSPFLSTNLAKRIQMEIRFSRIDSPREEKETDSKQLSIRCSYLISIYESLGWVESVQTGPESLERV